MYMCKQDECDGEQFIRSIEAAPEPMCVLCSNQQLTDLERFCSKSDFTVITADPTFNLGTFYITPISYKNLLMETDTGQSPVMLGRVLVHQTKLLRPFHYFASTLTRLCPNLVNIKAFGTDGEPELIKAFKIFFPNAIHLRCANHLRRNIKDKLNALKLHPVVNEIISDIFGKQVGSNLEHDLADSNSTDVFWKRLSRVKEKWNNLEKSCNPSQSPQFYDWFHQHKATVFADSAIRAVLNKALITDRLFTTNNSESVNHILKQEVEWKENKLPQLIGHIRAVSERQVSEVEKAVVGRGYWKFKGSYSDLVVSEDTWFSHMDDESKKKHMVKVFNRAVVAVSSSADIVGMKKLDVSYVDSGISTVPVSTLGNIWNKAEGLVNSKGVLDVPWRNDRSRLVRSTSSDQPHLVTATNLHYKCDAKCPMFKAFIICAHVVAAAQENGDLKTFIGLYCSGPNLSSIAYADLPCGSGHKGGIHKRKRKTQIPVETTSVHPCFQQSPSVSAACTTQIPTQPLLSKEATVTVSSPHSGFGSNLINITPTQTHVSSVSTCSIMFPSVSVSSPHFGVGSNFINITPSIIGSIPSNSSQPSMVSSASAAKKSSPFVLKFKTPHLKVCQQCRKDYSTENDTLGLVVSRAERRMISNLATGTQFLARESNSNYHLHLRCINGADSSFQGSSLKVPQDVKEKLNVLQKVYLMTCIGVPSSVVN